MEETASSRLILSQSFIADFARSKSPTPSSSSSRAQSPLSTGTGHSSTDDGASISLELLGAQGPVQSGPGSKSRQRNRGSIQSMPELDTSFLGGARGRGSHDTLSVFDLLSYTDVDTGQREEFQFLLDKENSWRRVCCHKGLVANLFFLLVMMLGIVLGEVLYPLEGVRGNGVTIANDTACLSNTGACISVRVVRAIGLFGFIGGITNWIAIEMLFIRVPFLIGTGVIAKQYKEIRGSIKRIVVNTLFDPSALEEYFTGHKKYAVEMLHLEQHFGGLLDSAAANTIVDRKIELALAGPEGFVLTLMGVDHSELKSIIRKNVRLFLADISPIILDKMSPGLVDGEGLQAEVERILEEKIEDLSATKVRQIITLIIRKHLSWLIVWGNVSGALVGVLIELATLLAAHFMGDL